MLLRFGWKQFPYCFTLAGCQNPPLPVVEKVGLGAAAERKRLTSSLTEDVCVCVCILWSVHAFLLHAYMMLTKMSANFTTEQMSELSAAHCGVVIH